MHTATIDNYHCMCHYSMIILRTCNRVPIQYTKDYTLTYVTIAVGTYIIFTSFIICNNLYVGVTQHPANNTFCEESNAVLSCVVFDNSTSSAANNISWFRDVNTNPVAVPSNMINNTRNGDVVTSVLTIENVALNDNGTGYFCSPSFGIRSYVGVISVLTGIVCIYVCMIFYVHYYVRK